MSIAIPIQNGIIHLSECKTNCPHCTRKFEYEEFEKQWDKSDGTIRKKCKGCKRFVGITMDIMGDFRAYPLRPQKGIFKDF